jgi:hypothetical protein
MKKAHSLPFRNFLFFCSVSLWGITVPLYGNSSASISLNPVLGANPKTYKRPLTKPSKEVKKNPLKEINQNNWILTPEMSDGGQGDTCDFFSNFFDSCKNFSLESNPLPESISAVPGQVAVPPAQAEQACQEVAAEAAARLAEEQVPREAEARLEEEQVRREAEERERQSRELEDAAAAAAARLAEEQARREAAFEGVRFLFELKEERSDAVTQGANEAIQELLKALRVSQESEEQRARRQVAPAELLAAADKGGQVVVTKVPAQSSYLKSINFSQKISQVLNNFFSWSREDNPTSAEAAPLDEERARPEGEEREPQAREREEAEPEAEALEEDFKTQGETEQSAHQEVEAQLAEQRERPQAAEEAVSQTEGLDNATKEAEGVIALLTSFDSLRVAQATDVDAAALLASTSSTSEEERAYRREEESASSRAFDSPASPVAEERFKMSGSDSRAQDCSSPSSVADVDQGDSTIPPTFIPRHEIVSLK